MPKVYSSFNSNSKKEKNYYKKSFFKTKGFYLLLCVIVIVGGFLIWSLTKSPSDPSQTEITSDTQQNEPEYKAVVNYLRGEAQYMTGTEQLWKSLSFTDKLDVGTTIRTKDESKLELTFPDGSIVRLADNSELQIQEISPADIVLLHVEGNAYHRVNKEGTAIYKVITNEDEFTALGTAFNTANKGIKLSELTVIESKVKIKVYKDKKLVNMKTIEEGKVCIIDKDKNEEEIIETKDVDKEKLLEDEWLSWNKEEDAKKDYSMGIFSDEVKLEISAPASLEHTTKEDSYKIKGITEEGATITIAGVKATIKDDNTFEYEVELSKGENSIEIVAELDDQETKKTIKITYDEDAEDEEEEIDGFTLSASATDNDVKLTWNVDSSEAEKGFKLVRSTSANPVYPGNDYKYIIQNDARTYTWNDIDKGTYHFRACLYTEGGKCKAYSNDVSVTINTEDKEEEPSNGKISLSGSASGTSAKLSWKVEGMESPQGFKVVKSTKANPVYPGDTYKYLSDSGSRSVTWSDLPAGTYHFRACEYLGGKCGVYSNDITITIESSEPAQTGTISLSGSVSGDTAKLTWSTSGLEAPKGFKVVKSTSANPVYPGNDYKYLSDPGSRSVSWSGLPAGTYHFRACQYLGGACGVYSNDITLTIEGSSSDPGTGSISLGGSSADGKAYLSWTVTGTLNVSNGYKVVISENTNPVYPGNEYHYLSSPEQLSDSWKNLTPGKTYHFRVCQYLGGACGQYSNDLSLTIK